MTRALKPGTRSASSSVRMDSVGSRASWTSLASPGSLVPRETSSVSTSSGLKIFGSSLISSPRPAGPPPRDGPRAPPPRPPAAPGARGDGGGGPRVARRPPPPVAHIGLDEAGVGQVGPGDDAEGQSIGVHNHESADLVGLHRLRHLGQRRLRGADDHALVHPLANLRLSHGLPPREPAPAPEPRRPR